MNRRTLRIILPASLMLLAGLVRLAGPDSPTLLGERQYRSALIARFYYYQYAESVEPWRMRIATMNRQREGALEPPILERVTAVAYAVAGGERLWIPRALSASFWLLGGFLLYRLLLRFLSLEGAAIGVSYYLFNPLGVHASISFLPDPLMIFLFVLALLALLRFHERPGALRLWTAAAAVALGVLVKPLCLFAITGAILALAIREKGFGQQAIDRSVVALLAAVALPTFAYYGYGVLLAPRLAVETGDVAAWDSLARSASVTFVPQLLLTAEYWLGWAWTVVEAMGGSTLVLALVGFALLRSGTARALVAGLLFGYVAFSLVFTYLIPFAGHYHLQLAVPLAIGIGRVGEILFAMVRESVRTPLGWAPPVAAVVLIAGLAGLSIQRELTPRPMESPEVAREIGDLVDHSSRVVLVATYYGKPLLYHGEFFGTWWPSAGGDYAFEVLKEEPRSVEARVGALGFAPEYFVVTDFTGFARRHDDLRVYLESRCSLVASDAAFRIYGECARPAASDASPSGGRRP